MQIYKDTRTRGPYGFDLKMIKTFKTNLLQEQHGHHLRLGMGWGCTPEYVLRNKMDYYISLVDSVDEEDLPYSAYRMDVWFGGCFRFRTDREAEAHYESQFGCEDILTTLTDGLVAKFYIHIKLGDLYQWNFRTGHTRPRDKYDDLL